MFKLPILKYKFNGLEPYYDTKTVEIHYTKHHQTYINNLNDAISKYPDFKNYSIEKLLEELDELPSEIKNSVRNNGGGYYNHNLFWEQFSSKHEEIKGDILDLINRDFSSFENFRKIFDDKAKTNFGSGWTWLVLNKNKQLEVMNTSGHDCPITNGFSPLIVIDIWEHAYYLKFQNRRPEWINSFWNIIDWNFVNKNLKTLI
ncbi:MAG: superoxide dismutase [Mycoplasmoidaceae bacterium]